MVISKIKYHTLVGRKIFRARTLPPIITDEIIYLYETFNNVLNNRNFLANITYRTEISNSATIDAIAAPIDCHKYIIKEFNMILTKAPEVKNIALVFLFPKGV